MKEEPEEITFSSVSKSANERNFIVQVFCLSLFCHLAFLFIVRFTCSTPPEAQKPNFVFLGSILKAADLANLGEYAAVPIQKIPLTPMHSNQRDTVSNTDLVLSVRKTPFSQQIPQLQKITLKPKMLFSGRKTADEKTLKELGINEETPKRIPLRLYTDDKN